MDGHMNILKVFGITMITSANTEWFNDPNTYVIIVESKDNDKVLGGARLHVSGGKYNLPIESAVGDLDDSIYRIIKEYEIDGTAELCGLWNSREIAGLGIGSILLTRSTVAVANQLKIKTIWALCAPYTVEMATNVGFKIATFIGDNGTFYYPKDDLLATAVILLDINDLSAAKEDDKNEIIKLRENPKQIKLEKGRRGATYNMEYDLIIKHDKIT